MSKNMSNSTDKIDITDISRQAIMGVGYISISKYLRLIVTFVSGIILARILLPEDFGKIAFVLAIIGLVEPIVGWGFAVYLIKAKEKIQLVINTMFTLRLLTVVVFMLIILIIAFFFKLTFYKQDLIKFLIIMGIFNLFARMASIPGAVIQKKFQFFKFAFLELCAVILSCGIAVAFVFFGFGIWSLVVKFAVYSLVSAIFFFWFCPTKFRIQLDREIIKDFLPFAKPFFIQLVLDKLFIRSGTLIVGIIAGTAVLGYYDRSLYFCGLFTTLVLSAMETVILPVFVKVSENKRKLSNVYRIISILVFRISILFYLIVGALIPEIISFLYGNKWLPTASLFRLMVVSGVFMALRAINQQIHFAVGDVKRVAHAQIVEVCLFIPSAVVFTYLYGVKWTIICLNIALVISFIILMQNIIRIVDIKLSDIFGVPIFAAILTWLVFLLSKNVLIINIAWLKLCIYSFVLTLVFLGLSFIMEGPKLMAIGRNALAIVRDKRR